MNIGRYVSNTNISALVLFPLVVVVVVSSCCCCGGGKKMTKQQQEMMMLNESYPNIPIVNTRPDPIHSRFHNRAKLDRREINTAEWFRERFVVDRKERFVIKLIYICVCIYICIYDDSRRKHKQETNIVRVHTKN